MQHLSSMHDVCQYVCGGANFLLFGILFFNSTFVSLTGTKPESFKIGQTEFNV